jgi:hypothetical protein
MLDRSDHSPEAIVSQSGTGDLEERIVRLEQQDQRLTQVLELLASREGPAAVTAGRRWDGYAAVIASFIGILALAISGYTAYVQRLQLRAQVKPLLGLSQSNAGPLLNFAAMNRGTGPAQINAVRVTVGGVPVRNWSEVMKAVGEPDGAWLILSTLYTAVISPGTDLVFARPADDEQSRAKFRELLPGGKHALAVAVCYCSVLDDCWTAYSTKQTDGKPPDAPCPITDAERFED